MFDKLKKAVFPEDELAKRVEKLEARLEDKVLAKESVRLFGPVSLTERVDGWVAYTEKLLRRVQQLEKANRTLLKTLGLKKSVVDGKEILIAREVKPIKLLKRSHLDL